MEVAGPLGTPLGLAQRKRASPRGEAGTSGFPCVSDSDRRVPAELGQESQASPKGSEGTFSPVTTFCFCYKGQIIWNAIAHEPRCHLH